MSKDANKDTEYEELKKTIRNGFPEENNRLSLNMRPYWNIRHEVRVNEDFILFGCRIIIPLHTQKSVLQKLHTSHKGVEKTKRRAHMTVCMYTGAINSETKNMCFSYQKYLENLPSQKK